MMKLLPTLTTSTAILFSLTTSAAFYPTERMTDAQAFPGFTKAREATPKFVNDSGSCSATFISNTGYILTAAHCATACLKSNGVEEVKKQITENIAIYELDAKPALGGTCIYYLSGRSYLAEIKAVGIGDISYKPNRLSAAEWTKVRELEAKGYGEQGDFAIFKVYGRHTCVPLATTAPTVSDRLFAIGYPAHTNRDNPSRDVDENSDGYSQYLSKGKRTRGVVDMTGLKEALDTRNYYFLKSPLEEALYAFNTSEIMSLWSRKLDIPSMIPMDVDLVFGNSGGGLYNRSGQLVGVTTALMNMAIPDDHEFRNFVPGLTRSINLQSILHFAKQQMSEDDFKAATTCRNDD